MVGKGLIDEGIRFNEILSKTDKSHLIHLSGLKVLLKTMPVSFIISVV